MLAGVLALTAAKTLTDRGRRCPARSCPGPCRSPGARVPGAHSRATRSTARATWREGWEELKEGKPTSLLCRKSVTVISRHGQLRFRYRRARRLPAVPPRVSGLV